MGSYGKTRDGREGTASSVWANSKEKADAPGKVTLAEQVISDEYQVVEFYKDNELGPVSSGHFPAGHNPELALTVALQYAEHCRAVAGYRCTYKVRRVTTSDVVVS